MSDSRSQSQTGQTYSRGRELFELLGFYRDTALHDDGLEHPAWDELPTGYQRAFNRAADQLVKEGWRG